jgi:NTE family protein
VRDFDQLHMSYASVAEDLRTGGRVVLCSGDPVRAADASAAIRRAFPPVTIDDQLLVDGINVEAVPVRAARELGATYVVAVDVLRVKQTRRLPRRKKACAAYDADIVIRPPLGNRSAWSFSLASEIISLGEHAAESAVSAIAAELALSGDADAGRL